jgi:predicted RNase H-like HicB family nuclease
MVRKNIMSKYEIILYWSNEDGVFVAEAPELPGCMAHGDTEEKALKNIKEAMRLWIDTARKFGDPIPEPKGRRLILA